MCLYVDDDIRTLDGGFRTARKDHRCGECHRVIGVGERYRYWVTLWEGEVETQKMCAHCWGTIELGSALTGCPQTFFWELVHEYDPGAESQGFVANILWDEGHHLSVPDRLRMLRTVAGRRRQWRGANGSLLPVPSSDRR